MFGSRSPRGHSEIALTQAPWRRVSKFRSMPCSRRNGADSEWSPGAWPQTLIGRQLVVAPGGECRDSDSVWACFDGGSRQLACASFARATFVVVTLRAAIQ
jgi:hypothetical protein